MEYHLTSGRGGFSAIKQRKHFRVFPGIRQLVLMQVCDLAGIFTEHS
jgi:hypothetical protein